MFGSTGLRLACCTIYPKQLSDVADFPYARRLDSEVDIGEEEIDTHDEFREHYGFTPRSKKDLK